MTRSKLLLLSFFFVSCFCENIVWSFIEICKFDRKQQRSVCRHLLWLNQTFLSSLLFQFEVSRIHLCFASDTNFETQPEANGRLFTFFSNSVKPLFLSCENTFSGKNIKKTVGVPWFYIGICFFFNNNTENMEILKFFVFGPGDYQARPIMLFGLQYYAPSTQATLSPSASRLGTGVSGSWRSADIGRINILRTPFFDYENKHRAQR